MVPLKKALRQLNELDKLGSSMRLAAEKWSKPWQALTATIMSARTRDEITIPVANNLFKKYNTVQKLSNAELKDVQKITRPVNFYRNKSKSIVNCAKTLVKYHNGKPPHDFERLMKLPGVGRKTANVFLAEMGQSNIGVDTHVYYISRKLGWSKRSKTEDVENDLKRLFPRKRWGKVNGILVRFGKTYASRKKKDEILGRIRNM